MFTENWNDVVEDVEKFTKDIMYSYLPDDGFDYDDYFLQLSRDIAYYTLMIIKKYS